MDIIFDIDDTLVDASHREHLYRGEETDWKEFYDQSIYDSWISSSVEVLLGLHNLKHRILLVTGRHEMARQVTIKKIKGLPCNALYMRPPNFEGSNAECKQLLLNTVRNDGFAPVAAFEDNPKSAEMWKKNGLIVYKVEHELL